MSKLVSFQEIRPSKQFIWQKVQIFPQQSQQQLQTPLELRVSF